MLNEQSERAALGAVRTTILATQERREYLRYDLQLPVTLRVRGQPTIGELKNLSRGGLLVRIFSKVGVEVGDFVMIEFTVGPTSQPCVVQGMVVRTDGALFGIQFEATSEAFDEFMEDVEFFEPELGPEFLETVLGNQITIT